MAKASVSTGMELEYETIGSPEDPALLLVMGFTAQLTYWPDDFCKGLADQGFYVIRYDNRDCGLSTKLDGVEVDLGGVMAAQVTGAEMPPVPYTLSAFSDDAFALLDALGVERAHIVGASMGGMIVQTMAIEHPERVLSMCSIMSTTGEREYGQPTPEAMAALLAPPPTDRQAYIDAAPNFLICASKKYGDADEAKRRAAVSYDRSFYPEGAPRQLSAILASPSRVEGLKAIRVPTLVIHGRDDTLIAPSGGDRTAELIDGSKYLLVSDMGHDLPLPLVPVLVDAIASNAQHA